MPTPLSHRATRATLRVLALTLVGTAAIATPAREPAGAKEPARWSWPVSADHAVRRAYEAPATAYGAGHRGVDLAGIVGEEVYAVDDGVVHFSGTVVDRPLITLRHEGGVLSTVEPVLSELAAGDEVRRGEPIGVLEPGHCVDECVHLGARLDGEYVSPMLLLGELPRAVLLPTRELP